MIISFSLTKTHPRINYYMALYCPSRTQRRLRRFSYRVLFASVPLSYLHTGRSHKNEKHLHCRFRSQKLLKRSHNDHFKKIKGEFANKTQWSQFRTSFENGTKPPLFMKAVQVCLPNHLKTN